MTTQTFYVLAFILTLLVAAFLLVLAVIVFLKGKREYLNTTLALTTVFTSFWIISGFVDKISSNPSDSFTIFVFQWAYAAGALALMFYFLFTLGMYLGRAPKKTFLYGMGIVA